MALRTGPFKTIRESAIYAASATYYPCETIKVYGNRLKVLFDVTVATGTEITFKIEVSENGTDFFEVWDESGIVEPEFDAGIGKKIVDIPVEFCPLQEIKLSFKCSAGHGAAKIKIQALSYDS